MKKAKIRIASAALSTVMLASTAGLASGPDSKVVAPEPEVAVDNTMIPMTYEMPTVDRSKVTDFVNRLYQVCLGRDADPTGLENWVNDLANRQQTGVSCAFGFIFSNEFQSKNCTNEEYVQYMYQAFFGREADPDGLKTWVNALESNWTRQQVFAGFANSAEFATLCANYGVVRGDYFEQYDWIQTAKVNLFVDRLYNSILGRQCDIAGMTTWSELLLSKQWSGAGVAFGFIFSGEFLDKNYCTDCYVNTLYQAFMGRSADPAGFETWTNELNKGQTWEFAFNGFVGSAEFTSICASYGIDRGDANFPGTHQTKAGVCSNCGETIVPPQINYVDLTDYKDLGVPAIVGNSNNIDRKLVVWSLNDEFAQLLDNYSSVKVDDYVIFSNSYDYMMSLSSGDGAPDLIVCDADSVRQFIEDANGRSYVMPINNLGINYSELSQMYDYTLRFASDSGKVIRGLTWQATPCGVFYNRTVAQKTLGVSTPEAVAPYFQDWTTFLRTAKTVANTNGGRYRVVSGWDEVYRPYLNSRKTGWIVNDTVNIDPVLDDFFDMTFTLVNNDWTWGNTAWSSEWTMGAYDQTVLSYWGPMWLGYSLGINNPEINPTSGDWGMVKAPTNYYWGGSWIMATNSCDRQADVAQIMRDIAINPHNLAAINAGSGDFVNNIGIMTNLAGSSAGNVAWLGGQNPYGMLLQIATTIDNSSIGIYDDDINTIFKYYVLDYANGDISSIATAKKYFIADVIELGYARK